MRKTLAVLTLGALGACAADVPEEDPSPLSDADACAQVVGCDTPVNAVEGPASAIWRVLVERDAAGAVQIGTVQEIDVPSVIGAPLGPLSGSFRLAGLGANDEPLEVQRLAFPDTQERANLDGDREEIDMSTAPVSVVGYVTVDSAVRSFALVDDQGAVVHMTTAPAPGEARVSYQRGRTTAGLIRGSARSGCDHIVVLNGPADDAWNPDPDYTVVEPSPTQLAVVSSALGRMSPLHCAAISRLVFVTTEGTTRPDTTGGWVWSTLGDTMFINDDFSAEGIDFSEASLQNAHPRALLAGIIVHETGHSLTRLLQYIRPPEGSARVDGSWPVTTRALADRTLDNARIQRDVSQVWLGMHRSFVSQDWAAAFTGETASLRPATPSQVAGLGFMSHYSSKDEIEDIAEYIAWPVVRRLYESAGVAVGPRTLRRGYACEAMREHSEPGIPSNLAAAYTKVSFLRSLGAINESDFEDCIGTSIGFPDQSEGITVFQEGQVRRVYTDGLAAGISAIDGQYHFTLDVEGTATFGDADYPAALRLEIDLGVSDGEPIESASWPRGVYELGFTSPHDFTLRMEDAPAGNFDVTDGFVLITEASNDRIVGSVFVTEAFRYQAPVPVPQTFDPPLQFRIRLDNSM